VNSAWIYFEAGYSYSKDIQVVPLGISGIDLSDIKPPLSLLQGFNIKSVDGLNNLIAVLNYTFSHSHSGTFTKDEFTQIFGEDEFSKTGLGEYSSLIDNIIIPIPCNVDGALDQIVVLFEKEGIQHQKRSNDQGATAIVHTHGLSFRKRKSSIYAELDPNLTSVMFKIVDKVREETCPDEGDSYTVQVNFIRRLTTYHYQSPKLTAKFYNSGVTFGDNDSFLFDDMNFRIQEDFGFEAQPSIFLDIVYRGNKLEQIKLRELIEILIEREIIFAR
jgi:hypothetical protein